jgi:uncharacterized protein YegP (UPF0339 family)
MEKFVIRKKANGEFHFDFTDKSGKVILSSYGYTRKTTYINGIEAVRRNSMDHTKFNCKKSPNSESYFNLKSSNGKIIGVSQVFEDKVSLDKGMESVKYKAQDALIEDESKYFNKKNKI